MLKPLDPFRFLRIALASWTNQHQLKVIDFFVRRIASCSNSWADAVSVSAMTSAADRRQMRVCRARVSVDRLVDIHTVG
jgi:hypothetical protein